MTTGSRKLIEMRKVIRSRWYAFLHPKKTLYEVYREVKTDSDLRYDVTVLYPTLLHKEFNRTKGNCNSDGFQELYTVLEGEAVFLLQSFEDKNVNDVFAVKVLEGEWIIIPPYHWVIIINPSLTEVLETGNWVSKRTTNLYKPLERMRGMSYFYTQSGWTNNSNYVKVPQLRFEESLKSKPESLNFLRSGMNK